MGHWLVVVLMGNDLDIGLRLMLRLSDCLSGGGRSGGRLHLDALENDVIGP